jgi:hypothetical protein
VQAYGRLLMERPRTAWWVLNARIRPQARAARDGAIWAYITECLAQEPDNVPYCVTRPGASVPGPPTQGLFTDMPLFT